MWAPIIIVDMWYKTSKMICTTFFFFPILILLLYYYFFFYSSARRLTDTTDGRDPALVIAVCVRRLV